jgi:hypothetical protein
VERFVAIRGQRANRAGIPVPPQRMRPWRDGRPLKRWRYVGAYCESLMLCAGDARIGPLRQRFWALATPDGQLAGRTALLGSGGVVLDGERVTIDAPRVRASLAVSGGSSFEVLSPHGRSYIWTRKTGGVRVEGLVELDGRPYQLDCEGLVDESAGYHARHTVWQWSAGVGRDSAGRPIAWNLVAGVHDDPRASERTVWIDGEPHEAGEVAFAPDLSQVGGLRFSEWVTREDQTNALLLRSSYRQPFGVFSGTLPGGVTLERGYGVMETHDVWW